MLASWLHTCSIFFLAQWRISFRRQLCAGLAADVDHLVADAGKRMLKRVYGPAIVKVRSIADGRGKLPFSMNPIVGPPPATDAMSLSCIVFQPPRHATGLAPVSEH